MGEVRYKLMVLGREEVGEGFLGRGGFFWLEVEGGLFGGGGLGVRF